MNKKLLLIAFVMTLLVGGIYAGLSLLKTDSTILISKDNIDALATKGIDKINVKATGFNCDSSECWSDVKQDNLIQTQFRTSKSYCSKNEEYVEDETTNITQVRCIEYKDYTLPELTAMRDSFVKNRIEGYAESIKADNSKSSLTQLDDGGIITNCKPVG